MPNDVVLSARALGWLAARAVGAGLSQARAAPASPWPKGSREAALWPTVRALEEACRDLNELRGKTGIAAAEYEAVYRHLVNFSETVDRAEGITEEEREWVKRTAFALCGFPRGAAVRMAPIPPPKPKGVPWVVRLMPSRAATTAVRPAPTPAPAAPPPTETATGAARAPAPSGGGLLPGFMLWPAAASALQFGGGAGPPTGFYGA
jgi:hypothetical protein